ncbi:hypothetical protein PG994_007157 [Apiospora phragmitis]|uniref:Uncharacterized protein n=1 Tax=Apiospora phragmitis TaxID=2905665 RepID=A0ABR1V356_9PEZI
MLDGFILVVTKFVMVERPPLFRVFFFVDCLEELRLVTIMSQTITGPDRGRGDHGMAEGEAASVGIQVNSIPLLSRLDE